MKFDQLIFDNTISCIDEFLELEKECAHHADSILPVLERIIGSLTNGLARQELIQLRRDIFNDRVPKAGLSAGTEEDLASGISLAQQETLKYWMGCRQNREEVTKLAREAFEREFSSKRLLMAQMFHNREFRKGLALASPTLSQALERLVQATKPTATPRRRRIERGAFRYYTRAAFKLSPFSSFTRTRLVRLLASGAERRPFLSGGRLRRHVTVNRTLIAYIVDAMSTHPELADQVPIYSARSARRDGDTLSFVRHRYASGGPNRLRVPQETLVRIRETRAISWILSYLESHGGMACLGDLRNAFAIPLGDVSTASSFITKLIELGLLIHRLPLPEDDTPSLECLLAFLNGKVSSVSGNLQCLVKKLIALTGKYPAADSIDRRDLLKTITDTVSEIFATLNIGEAENWDGLLLYEDCLEHPTTETVCPPEWGHALKDLQEFFRIYTVMLDGNISIRETIKHTLTKDFNCGPVPFLTFAERYNQLCGGDRTAGHMAEMSYTINPLDLPTLNELAEIRQEFGAFIRQDGDAECIDLRALAIASRWPERVARIRLTMPTESVTCFSAFCQPVAGSVLVVNKIQPGPCRPLLRFCASLSDCQERAETVAFVDRWLTALRERSRPCEVLARFDYNVNLAPFVTAKVINYSSNPEHKADNSLELGELYLSVNDADEIVLTHQAGTHEEEIVPVVFGMMASTFEPPLECLLLSLGTSEPVLYRPFDPQGWSTEEKPSITVSRYPRLTFGDCVIRRRGWSILRSHLPSRAAAETDFDYFVRVRRWQKQLELPDEVFARARSFKRRMPLSGPVPEQRNRILHKPQYVHFGNFFLVDLLDQMFQDSVNQCYIEEALPSSQDWAQQHISRAVEFVVDSAVQCKPSEYHAGGIAASQVVPV